MPLLVSGCCHLGAHHDEPSDEIAPADCRREDDARADAASTVAIEPAHDGHVATDPVMADAECEGAE